MSEEIRDLEWARKTFANDRFATEAAGVVIEEAGDQIMYTDYLQSHRNAHVDHKTNAAYDTEFNDLFHQFVHFL